MTIRTLYDGCIPIAANDYTHTAMAEGGDYDEMPIPELDVVLTPWKSLVFTLDYPFELPFEGKVVGPSGVTLRLIVDAVRAGFRTMYAGGVVADIPGLSNKRVSSPYGEAVHDIEDLVIEAIELDEDEGRLEIVIGS